MVLLKRGGSGRALAKCGRVSAATYKSLSVQHMRRQNAPLFRHVIKVNALFTQGTLYLNKNSNNGKIESVRGDDGKRAKAFFFPSCPTRRLFLSPQPPYNTKRPLRSRKLTVR